MPLLKSTEVPIKLLSSIIKEANVVLEQMIKVGGGVPSLELNRAYGRFLYNFNIGGFREAIKRTKPAAKKVAKKAARKSAKKVAKKKPKK